MNFSEVFIHRPIATSLLMAALALVGIVAFPLLPVAPLPQVDFPTIQVTATLTGASPETMGATVATPLERQFGQIAGVTQMSSVSSLGSTRRHAAIRPQPQYRRRRTETCRLRSRPPAHSFRRILTSPPTYKKVNPADSPILIVAATSGHIAAAQGRRFCRERRRHADFADYRGVARRHRRPAAAGYSRADRSGQADGARADDWRTCAPRSPAPRPMPPRARFSAGSRASPSSTTIN